MPSYPNFPILSRRPALKTKETTIDPTLRDSMDNGMESTRAKFTRLRREFEVTFEFLTVADVAMLVFFVQTTVVYGAGPFYFTDNRGGGPANTYIVRFSKLPAYTDAGWVEESFRQNVTFSIREM